MSARILERIAALIRPYVEPTDRRAAASDPTTALAALGLCDSTLTALSMDVEDAFDIPLGDEKDGWKTVGCIQRAVEMGLMEQGRAPA